MVKSDHITIVLSYHTTECDVNLDENITSNCYANLYSVQSGTVLSLFMYEQI